MYVTSSTVDFLDDKEHSVLTVVDFRVALLLLLLLSMVI